MLAADQYPNKNKSIEYYFIIIIVFILSDISLFRQPSTHFLWSVSNLLLAIFSSFFKIVYNVYYLIFRIAYKSLA